MISFQFSYNDTISGDDFAHLFGVSHQAISKAKKAGRLRLNKDGEILAWESVKSFYNSKGMGGGQNAQSLEDAKIELTKVQTAVARQKLKSHERERNLACVEAIIGQVRDALERVQDAVKDNPEVFDAVKSAVYAVDGIDTLDVALDAEKIMGSDNGAQVAESAGEEDAD